MASKRGADEMFVALPDTYEDGISVLSWVFSNFPRDRTKIIITHVTSSPFKGLFDQVMEREKMDSTLRSYLSDCKFYEFRAEKLVHIAYDIAEGIVEVIAKHGTKNLVMRSAANSDMTALTSETANKVMREANRSCKLWFVSDENLICTREVNSDNLTPAPTSEQGSAPTSEQGSAPTSEQGSAPTSEEGSCRNGRSNEASSSIFTRSNSESGTEDVIPDEIGVDIDASSNEMLLEAYVEAENFEKKSEEIFEAHKKMGRLVIRLAKNLEQKELDIRKLKEVLRREKQINDQLRQEIEEIKHKKHRDAEIEKMKIEDLLRGQRDEYLNQNQVANDKVLALETQVSELELVIEDYKLISASVGSHIDSLQDKLSNLQQERDSLVVKVQELSTQIENMHSGFSTSLLNSEFSLQELQQATQNFNESLKIGHGGFGSVYKGCLRQTTVAIKLLHFQSLQGISQFRQEVTILTKVRHPNLVTLIGSCSEISALVYEHLSNGSLEDRLTCVNNTPPLTWHTRTRIIGEICLALIFLHSNKPQLVVHGDLKPENILLDTNLVSKLSDFGIARLLIQPDTNTGTAFLQTSRPVGTFAYIDPEYLTTGILTPKSDIYSFGITILRLLTGLSPLNIATKVQEAMRNGILESMIDKSAGTWPSEQTEQLAKVALRCTELSRSQRPDLVNDVWAVVEPLMKAASTYVESRVHESERGEESIPSHFICPILQEVMQEPYIAADGFTYEKDAIREWLRRGHSTSPMTNLALPHRNLIPNLVLRSAIQDWLQRRPQS